MKRAGGASMSHVQPTSFPDRNRSPNNSAFPAAHPPEGHSSLFDSLEFLFFPEVDATLLTKRGPLEKRQKNGAALTPLEAYFALWRLKREKGGADGKFVAPTEDLAKNWHWRPQRTMHYLHRFEKFQLIERELRRGAAAQFTFDQLKLLEAMQVMHRPLRSPVPILREILCRGDELAISPTLLPFQSPKGEVRLKRSQCGPILLTLLEGTAFR